VVLLTFTIEKMTFLSSDMVIKLSEQN